MIIFVTTHSHRYTHDIVARWLPMVRQASYPVLFARRRLPCATYIFTDFDRLGFFQLEYAAHVFRVLRDAGCRVLNDPARALQRLALLQRLQREGVNSFGAWAAHDVHRVDRFPVFLRHAAAHRGTLTPLLSNPEALSAMLESLLATGHPMADLIVVEYRAEPLAGDVFRKMSVYRVGARFVTSPSVHERNWTAKHGEDGVAGEPAYVGDLDHVRANPHAEIMRRAFDIASVEYGRSDYALVAGRVEIYEINTNPMITPVGSPRLAIRAEASQHAMAAYQDAVRALDTVAATGSIPAPRPTSLPRRRRLLPAYQWMP